MSCPWLDLISFFNFEGAIVEWFKNAAMYRVVESGGVGGSYI